MGHKPRTHRLEGYWPLPSLAEHGDPSISDGFSRQPRKHRPRGHLGVDIMYRRPEKGPWNRPDFAPWYHCPKGTSVHTIADGKVVAVDDRPNGFAIKVDHGYPYVSVYRHVFEPCVEEGETLVAGEMLGLVGYDPRNPNGLRHLHMELLDYSRPGIKSVRNLAVDPRPFLKRLEYLR